MPEIPAGPRTQTHPADTARTQQAILLRAALSRTIRCAQLMLADLNAGEVDISRADQLGHSVLTALKTISGSAGGAAREAA